MLIDTKQIINLTELRSVLGRVMEEVASGKTYLISDRGEVKGAIVPTSYLAGGESGNVWEQIERVQKMFDRDYAEAKAKGRKIWKSEEVIRKMRDERSDYLAKRDLKQNG